MAYVASSLRVMVCLALLLGVALANASILKTKGKPQIAIIIDDLGYKLREGRQSILLAWPLTLAIIPSSPHARSFAEAANCREDKEILVHLPMSPTRKIAWEAGLNQDMNQVEFTQTAERLLEGVPFATGVNNHGGSQLTQDRERMDWLMTLLGRKQLFFVDSRTTPDSVATEAAAFAQIPFTVRDVFLDNNLDAEAINKQLDLLVAIAIKEGQAIGIGHPHKETLAVLEQRLAELEAQGLELVVVSRLLEQQWDFAARNRLTDAKSRPAIHPVPTD